jgi:hypothetical protein
LSVGVDPDCGSLGVLTLGVVAMLDSFLFLLSEIGFESLVK